MSDARNVLLVCVDCLREDVVAADRTDTPFLDSLRERGLACSTLVASASTTTPAVASLLTGSRADRHGVLSLNRGSLAAGVPTLASRLAGADFHTEALVTGPLVPETGLDRGFDGYECREPGQSLFGDWRERACSRLATLPEPFCAFVHLWELHEPVSVPDAFDHRAYGETPYGRALSALDRAIAALANAVPPETLVAVVGDHGESITHRDNPLRLAAKALRDGLKYYGGVDTRPIVERLNRAFDRFGPDVADHWIENNHGENVFDFATNVPFVLAGPGVDPATVDAQVRQIDVLPTILDRFGLDADVHGEVIDPVAGVDDRVAVVRACGASLHGERNWARAVRADGAKYVEYPWRDWDPGLYDLEADPRELRRVEDPALEAHLRALLPDAAGDPGDATRLDVEERLADLGYR